MRKFQRKTNDQHSGDHPAALALRLLKEGDLPGAEAATLYWVSLEPQNPEALIYLGLIYRDAGRHRDVLDVAGRLRPLDPKSAAAGASQALLAMEHWSELLVRAREWVQYAPDTKDAWLCLWTAAHELEDAAAEAEAIRGLGQFEPNRAAQCRTLARALARAGQWSDLADHAYRWLGEEPGSSDAHIAYLTGLWRSEQNEKVIEHIEWGWPEAHRDSIAIAIAVQAYNAAHRYHDTIAVATRVLGIEDCPDIVWREQSWALLQLGQYEAAATSARKYLQSNPSDCMAVYILANSLIEARRYAEALPITDRWLELDPIPSAWSRKIHVLIGLERFEDAAAAAETLALMAPDDPNAASLLATALAGSHDPRAMNAAQRWVQLAPGSAEARLLLDRLSQDEC